MDTEHDIHRLKQILFQTWSLQSSSKWTPQNPAMGQCGVTSLVVQELLGGQLVKTKLPVGWHYYNVINGRRYDFTESQFAETIRYDDLLATRDEAFSDTNDRQYQYLRQSVLQMWNASSLIDRDL
nr:hypothetical protein [Brevibacillus migulae]